MTIRTYFKARDIYHKHKDDQRKTNFGFEDVENLKKEEETEESEGKK